MNGQILKDKITAKTIELLDNPEYKLESAITIVPPKEAVSEMIIELKKLKDRKDDLLLPIQDELEEIEEKKKHIKEEITLIMIEENMDGITLPYIRNDVGAATFKSPNKTHMFYKKEKLDAIAEPEIREVLDKCLEESKQGEPTVKLEVF